MSNYLDQFLSTLPQTQKQKLMELLELKQREGYIKSDTEFQAELERLLKVLDSVNATPTFQGRHQTGKTDSKSYNSNLEEIAFDLSTLFEASNQIDSLMDDNQRLSRSMLSDIRKKIYALNAEVEKQALIMKNTDGFVEGVHEQFKAPQYTETSESSLAILRKDRYGQYLNNKYSAEIVSDSLQLASFETIDQLKNPYGRKLASIQVLNRIGTVATNNNHPISNAIDGSQETFWAEVILADDVITQNISDLWTHDYEGYEMDGAMCELEIRLNGITTVSEISLDPYASYPLEIVAIHGYESSDYAGKTYKLVTPNHENPHQRSKKSVGQMTFQFPSVDVAKIRILLRQENYVKENYLVNVDEQNNMELWNKIAGSAELMQLGTDAIADQREPGETIAEFDKKNQLTGWSQYLTALQEWAEKQGDKAKSVLSAAKSAMEQVRMGNYQNPMMLALRSISANTNQATVDEGTLSQQYIAANKLSYLYGLYNVSITGRKYLQRSIYVSQGLPVSGNVKRMSLVTEEKHHDMDLENGDKARITDVEYYISYKKNPEPTAWHPIMPADKDYVRGELLLGSSVGGDDYLLQNTINFSFRFPVISKDTVAVRRDGVPIGGDQYVITDDGKRIGIRQSFYSASSIYTVDYKPVSEAYYVDVDAETVQPMQYINLQGETGEYFNGVNANNTITLQHTPYVYRSEIFNYDSQNDRYTQDSSQLSMDKLYYPVIVRVGGAEYKNITDYASGTYDKNRLQNENDGRNFAQIGNTLYFPISTFDGELKDIVVDYYYLTTDVRLKAILRRNSAGYESVTPSVYSWSIRCQTYDQEVRDE
ncbi:hypothetical protein PUW25_26355 (plasmid) [Paenibacillus urinalis]|uniref:F5/8 type C domain-containing protein n=1 Tax=Paenibacillus urinalis TaxID=521520 RepID=A0ABY7XJQ3_9BACL|nr:hypothetical protein [Paenibacillus urinalis]WDI05095.1 hypothetical protein PUW25_26355 [Paenibacillus urinalis]